MNDYRLIIPACPNGHGSRYCTFEMHRWSCGLCGETFVAMPRKDVEEADKSFDHLIIEAHDKVRPIIEREREQETPPSGEWRGCLC